MLDTGRGPRVIPNTDIEPTPTFTEGLAAQIWQRVASKYSPTSIFIGSIFIEYRAYSYIVLKTNCTRQICSTYNFSRFNPFQNYPICTYTRYRVANLIYLKYEENDAINIYTYTYG